MIFSLTSSTAGETTTVSILETPQRRAPRAAPRPGPADGATRSLLPVAQIFLCDFVAKVLWGVAGLALIRFLPANEYASLTLALALSGLMIEGVSENLNRIYIIGHAKLHLAAAPLPFLTLQLSVLAVIIGLLCVFWNGRGIMVVLIAAVALSGSLLAFVKTVLQRELNFWSFSLVELARTLLFATSLAVLIALLQDGTKAWEVLLLQATCVTLVAAVALARTLEPGRLGQARRAWPIGRQIATSRYALMIGYILVIAVFARIDVLMLKMLDSPLELATYGAAFRYYAMLTLLLAAIHSVLLPLTQRTRQKQELELIFAKYRRAVFAVVPVVLLGAWISQWFIPLIDGGKYAGTVNVFRVLSISTVIGLACSPYVNLLFRYGDFTFLLGLVSAVLGLNVGLNAVLIPHLHSLGAAMALCLATGMMNILVYARARTLMASRPLPANANDDYATT